VPNTSDKGVYLVVDDFGSLGQSWRETNVGDTDFEMVVDDLLEGQYNNPVLVVGFNVAEGWSRDVSVVVAQALRERCAEQMRELPPYLEDFVFRHTGKNEDPIARRPLVFDARSPI
jgi:hypothetical protein